MGPLNKMTVTLQAIISNAFSLRKLVDILRSRQDGRHFADDIFKCIFLNENYWIPAEISLKFVPKDLIDIIAALV